MASGHVSRIKRPNTWLHRPMLQNVKKALANTEPSTHGTKRTFRHVRSTVASDLTILNVIWAPRMTIMPHNHQMWAVIGVYTGREDNIFWRRLPGGGGKLEAAGARALSAKDAEP